MSGRIVANMGYAPVQLHPHFIQDQHGSIVALHLYEGLVRSGKEGVLLPGLAKSIQISNDGLDYQIELREAYWSNGDSLTAEDFVRSWKSVMTSSVRVSSSSCHFNLIRGVKQFKNQTCSWGNVALHVVSKNTFAFSLEHSVPYFLDLLTLPIFYPVYSDNKEEITVSNGPFRFKEMKWGQSISLEKNPFFWDQESVDLPEVQFLFVEEPHTQTTLFEAGDIHFMGGGLLAISREAVDDLKKKDLLSEKYDVACGHYAILNTRRRIFQSKKIRLAFSMSLNRSDMAKGFFKRCIAAYAYLPPAISFDKKKSSLIEENPVQAKKLLLEGLEELNLSISDLNEVCFFCTTTCLKLAQALQAQWLSHLGILIKVQCLDYQTLNAKLSEGDFDFGCITQVAKYRDPYSFFEDFGVDDYMINPTGWGSFHFENLFKFGFLLEGDPRVRHINHMEQIVLSEMPMIPIAFGREVYSIHPDLNDVQVDELMMVDFSRSFWKKN